MTDLLDTIRPEPERDRWGRYRLPDPETGEQRVWTRATTVAGTLKDTFALTAWECRMVAKGVATRPDLYALAAATDVEDRESFAKIVEAAKDYAGASSGRNQGSALHLMTQRLHLEGKVEVPAPWRDDIAAYEAKLAEAKIETIPEYVERIVCVPELGVAGTLDRIVRVAPDNGFYIGDLKTSKNIDYGWLEIAAQLALYAHATHMWTGDHWIPMLPVSQERALVIHLPSGQGECDLYWVDIAKGWHIAKNSITVRAIRSAAKGLSWEYGKPEFKLEKITVVGPEPDTDLIKMLKSAPTIADLARMYKKLTKEDRTKDIDTAVKQRMLEIKNSK